MTCGMFILGVGATILGDHDEDGDVNRDHNIHGDHHHLHCWSGWLATGWF